MYVHLHEAKKQISRKESHYFSHESSFGTSKIFLTACIGILLKDIFPTSHYFVNVWC